MVERVVAAADLFTAIPSMWSDGRVTVGVIVLVVGAIIAACTLHKGVGKAIGVFIGACILAALVLRTPDMAQELLQGHRWGLVL